MEEIWNQITRLIGAYIPKLLGALAILIVGWLVPHQLFLTSIPRWCGTSARGASPPSALGIRLAEHPPSVGEPRGGTLLQPLSAPGPHYSRTECHRE
ncbi:MAG: hypothetical protein ACE1Z6_06740 [Candidatus Methylomirabilales bacterium]